MKTSFILLFFFLFNLRGQSQTVDIKKTKSLDYQFKAFVRNSIKLVCQKSAKDSDKLGDLCTNTQDLMDFLVEINFRSRLSGGNRYWGKIKDKTVKEVAEIFIRVPKDDQHLFDQLRMLDKKLEGINKKVNHQ